MQCTFISITVIIRFIGQETRQKHKYEQRKDEYVNTFGYALSKKPLTTRNGIHARKTHIAHEFIMALSFCFTISFQKNLRALKINACMHTNSKFMTLIRQVSLYFMPSYADLNETSEQPAVKQGWILFHVLLRLFQETLNYDTESLTFVSSVASIQSPNLQCLLAR